MNGVRAGVEEWLGDFASTNRDNVRRCACDLRLKTEAGRVQNGQNWGV